MGEETQMDWGGYSEWQDMYELTEPLDVFRNMQCLFSFNMMIKCSTWIM